MAHKNILLRHIPLGEMIKPWLLLGPFNIDFSEQVVGLTYFEQPPLPTSVGMTAINRAVNEACNILESSPCEGHPSTFLGRTASWNLVRGPEKYYSWGTYNIKNHLGAAFLTSLVTPDKPGERLFHVQTRIYQRIMIYINGKPVFDNDLSKGTVMEGVNHYEFSARLLPGENRIMVGLFRIARMAQVGIRLVCDDSDLTATIPIPDNITIENRERVEQELASIRFDRDVFYPDHRVEFTLGSAPSSSIPGLPAIEVALTNQDGNILYQHLPQAAGRVFLCNGSDLQDDTYQIECSWKNPDNSVLTKTTFTIRKVTPHFAPQGYERIDERRNMVLNHYARGGNRSVHDIWTQVARYALGYIDQVEESKIRETCQFIAARNDCADFVIQAILRLMFWEREKHQLSPEINAMMKDTVLGFKYWVDEPGDTVMYMGSENHRLLFHVAEWMAGLLFPTDEFTNSRQNGLFHYQKAYVYITEWLRQRGRFGFDEWHSNSYAPICISPLLNLYDFAVIEGQYKFRQMVQGVLDQMFFYLAADTFEGIWGTTHGRSYGIYVKYADFEGTSALCWLMYGTGSLTQGTSGMAPVCLATSSYRVPEIFDKIAHDKTMVIDCRQRQGILRTSMKHADFEVYRTPDYMISGLQDHRKGEYEGSSHVTQVTLGNKALIFWSCPHATGEGSGLRPDYWSGHTTLPRVVQYKNVMSLTWRLSPFAWMSHCWFEQARFDEVRFDDRWVFARVGKGYVGIYSINGMQVGDFGQYAGRELQCWAPENTWIVECGREADWGSFNSFVNGLKSAKIEEKDGVVRYESPSIGVFLTGWEVVPSVAGKAIQLHGYALYDSEWGYSGFGSGELCVRYDKDLYEIWFNQ